MCNILLFCYLTLSLAECLIFKENLQNNKIFFFAIFQQQTSNKY